MILHSCMPHVWTNNYVHSLNTQIYFIQGTIQFQFLKYAICGVFKVKNKVSWWDANLINTPQWRHIHSLSSDCASTAYTCRVFPRTRVDNSRHQNLQWILQIPKGVGGSLSSWLFQCLVYKLHVPTVKKLNAMSSITLQIILLCTSQHFQES